MQEIIIIAIAIILIIGIIKKLFKLVKIAIIIGLIVLVYRFITPYIKDIPFINELFSFVNTLVSSII